MSLSNCLMNILVNVNAIFSKIALLEHDGIGIDGSEYF